MLKAWSITTTVRNPERLRDFLTALRPLEGKVWNRENQENYQRLLIKNRLYGYGNQQFYNGLESHIIDLINDVDKEINDEVVDDIIKAKNYREFAMRGRQSINPLTKFGFVYIHDGIIEITDLGQELISSEKDYGDVFLKSFIKWQIPNPASDDFSSNGDYNIVPFVGTLKLINEVNKLEIERGRKSVGLSKREFSLFIPSLIRYRDIEKYATKIIELRDLQTGRNREERKKIRDDYRNKFASEFLNNSNQRQIDKFLTNLKDYADNAIRYFRLTKFIRIRGNGFYIDLEPSRDIEIRSLVEKKYYVAKNFADKDAYLEYMSNNALPELPWQTKEKLSEIILNLHKEIVGIQKTIEVSIMKLETITNMSPKELLLYVDKLREDRHILQEKLNHIQAQPSEALSQYIENIENIYQSENKPLMLEHMSTMGLHSLNDAKEIKPNYPVGDDNEPTSTAPGGMADIECYYETFNMICEVTMLNGVGQWFNEGQPVMRHLREFENTNKNSYCLFIAPKIHTDTAETFWFANTHGYKGSKQKIAPITIKQFVNILSTLKKLRELDQKFTHDNLEKLIKNITVSTEIYNNSDDWVENVEKIVNEWSVSLVRPGN
ncbi:AlwI family type II restriction endonuclease [Candidatus Woesebacteria bacterium]|nr:AlwI family type II restriction endonuclease [Candidatus Woesebacteria bacterium]